MRVLMLGWEFPPHASGGLGTACQGLVEALTELRVEVLLVLPRAHGDERAGRAEVLGCDPLEAGARNANVTLSASKAATAVAAVAPRTAADCLQVLSVPSPLRPYMTAEGYARRARAAARGADPEPEGGYGLDLFDEVERYARVVARIAREREVDVIHAHEWMTVPAGLAAREACGAPLVFHVHASEHDRNGARGDRRIRAVEAAGVRGADRVIAVSHYTAGILRREYGAANGTLRVVHNAVRMGARRGDGRKPGEEPLVLFLGRLTPQKGPTTFLDAARRVLEVEPRVRFVVSGTGDLLPELEARASELGLADRVEFTGFLRGDEVERMYARADVYVMPSVSEPFGISPLEALAHDVPVIVSCASGVAEVLPRSSLKVEPGDVEGLADRVLALLRRPALRRQLVELGREELRDQRWELRARSVLDVYRELVA